MTDELVQRLRELEAKATPGPWRDRPSVHGTKYRYVQINDDTGYTTLELLPEDARLIVALRNAIPELLSALTAAQERIGSLERDLKAQSDAWHDQEEKLHAAQERLAEVKKALVQSRKAMQEYNNYFCGDDNLFAWRRSFAYAMEAIDVALAALRAKEA